MKNLFVLLLCLPVISISQDLDISTNTKTQSFIEKMATKYGFEREKLYALFKKAKFQKKTLHIYNTPFKTYKNDASWTRYKKHIITDEKIQNAKVFMKTYHDSLLKAEQTYQVPKEYIAAFIGVESNFGTFMGDKNIFDSLATLAFFDNRKEDFFRLELEYFLLITRDKRLDPLKQKGSFAGAMGCVQQLPSVHHIYGVDFDEDGVKNLFDMDDCIGTIAHFMQANGWENERVVTVQASYHDSRYKGLVTGFDKIYTLEELKNNNIKPIHFFPEEKASLLQIRDTDHDELWLGANNFRVLSAYNHSTNYAMAIYQIAKRLTP